jgi:colicin import membrane protein
MTSTPHAGAGTPACKRPGCDNTLPAGAGRGRHRVFCSDDCARRYHNDARIPAPAAGSGGPEDPLAALEPLLRQAAVLTRAARDQATALDPARVRAEIADAEAARRRADAAAVTAQARQAEAEAETQALTEALATARDDKATAENAARHAQETARALTAELDQVRREGAEQIAAAGENAREQAAAARADAGRFKRERDDALTAARDARAAAATEISRARQAETDARDETQRVRDDAARERDALRDSHAAQLEAQRALTSAERARAERAETQLETERADRRQLTTHITSNSNSNHDNPARTQRGQIKVEPPAPPASPWSQIKVEGGAKAS